MKEYNGLVSMTEPNFQVSRSKLQKNHHAMNFKPLLHLIFLLLFAKSKSKYLIRWTRWTHLVGINGNLGVTEKVYADMYILWVVTIFTPSYRYRFVSVYDGHNYDMSHVFAF